MCAAAPTSIGFIGGASLRASAAHAFAVGVEDRLRGARCGAALAEDFQLKTVRGSKLGRDVAEG